MTTALDGHIVVDDRGVARIAGSRMKVIHLVMDKIAHDSTPEQMVREFPSLTLAQVHAALAYYYDHQTALDAEIERSLSLSDNPTETPTRTELRARLAQRDESGEQP